MRVITPPPQDNGQEATEPESSVPLRDVFESQQWQEAVDASPLRAHRLTLMSYDAFISSPTSRVLSYRWNQKVRLDCAVQDPWTSCKNQRSALLSARPDRRGELYRDLSHAPHRADWRPTIKTTGIIVMSPLCTVAIMANSLTYLCFAD